jgi:hypothetical protein
VGDCSIVQREHLARRDGRTVQTVMDFAEQIIQRSFAQGLELQPDASCPPAATVESSIGISMRRAGEITSASTICHSPRNETLQAASIRRGRNPS